MESARRDELVPLKTSFTPAWRGWDRTEVSTYLVQLETEIRRLVEHRDKLVEQNEQLESQLSAAQEDNTELRQKVDWITAEPIRPEALDERMRRRVELAEEQAKDIHARAQAAADQRWSQAQESADRLLASYEQMVSEAHRLRGEAETEYQQLLDRARRDVEEMTRQGQEQRQRVEAETQRRQMEAENAHEASLAARLNEVNRQAEQREQESREYASRYLADASEQARQRLDGATGRVEELRELRLGVAERLQSAQRILHRATAALEPEDGGDDTPSDSPRSTTTTG